MMKQKAFPSMGNFKKVFGWMWPAMLFVGVGAFALESLSHWLIQDTAWGGMVYLLFIGTYLLGFRMRERLLKIHLKHPDDIRLTLP